MLNTTPRRVDRTLPDSEAQSILEHGSHGTLALHSCDDYPYCVPLNYAKAENVLYFHCAPEGKKLECIRKDCRAMFCVVGNADVRPQKFTLNYSSVFAFGKVSVCTDESERIEALKMLIRKFSPEFCEQGFKYIEKSAPRTTILKFVIETVSVKGKRVPA